MKRKQFIKSGASNYGRPYDGGYDYKFEGLYYELDPDDFIYRDEDSEEDENEYHEPDYDYMSEIYQEAFDNAESILDRHDVDNSSRAFYVTIENGYYDGMQTVVHDGESYYGYDVPVDEIIDRHTCFENIEDAFEELKKEGWE